MEGKKTYFSHDPLTQKIIAGAIDVHRALGPGLLESAYEECLAFELKQRGLEVERQVALPLSYKGVQIDCGYRIDMFIEKSAIRTCLNFRVRGIS